MYHCCCLGWKEVDCFRYPYEILLNFVLDKAEIPKFVIEFTLGFEGLHMEMSMIFPPQSFSKLMILKTLGKKMFFSEFGIYTLIWEKYFFLEERTRIPGFLTQKSGFKTRVRPSKANTNTYPTTGYTLVLYETVRELYQNY